MKHSLIAAFRVGGFAIVQSVGLECPGVALQMDIVSLPNNTLVAAFNDSPDKRTPLRLATSTDGGVIWTRQALIEDDPVGSFHYPALLYDPKNVSAASCLGLPQEEGPALIHGTAHAHSPAACIQGCGKHRPPTSPCKPMQSPGHDNCA